MDYLTTHRSRANSSARTHRLDTRQFGAALASAGLTELNLVDRTVFGEATNQ
jgi:hypothetical protein